MAAARGRVSDATHPEMKLYTPTMQFVKFEVFMAKHVHTRALQTWEALSMAAILKCIMATM